MAEFDNLGFFGKEFQNKIIWQLLVDNKFGESIVNEIEPSYMDDPYLKRIIVLYKNYFKDNNKVPSLHNASITTLIHEKITNEIEKETLNSILNKIKNYNSKVLKSKIPDDGDVIQKQIWSFIKQQKYINLAKTILKDTTVGNLDLTVKIEHDANEISKIGIEFDMGEDLLDDIDETLEANYRSPIPTGIIDLDNVMGGGLGKGEMGFMLAALGTGKTTFLSNIANHAYINGFNVCQIFFEDTYRQVRRKHFTCMSDIRLSELECEEELVKERVKNKTKDLKNFLKLKKFSQDDNVTIPFIKNWILQTEKLMGIKFDLIVLDYVDCVECHDKNKNDELANEIKVVKSFEAMLADMNIAGWSAFQGNRTSIGQTEVHTGQMGGNIKKAQKAHFLMSVGKDDTQKEMGLATVKILKSRFGKDGIIFENSIFDNDKMLIEFKNGGSSMDLLQSSPPTNTVNTDYVDTLEKFKLMAE